MSEFDNGKLNKVVGGRLNPKFAVHADKVSSESLLLDRFYQFYLGR